MYWPPISSLLFALLNPIVSEHTVIIDYSQFLRKCECSIPATLQGDAVIAVCGALWRPFWHSETWKQKSKKSLPPVIIFVAMLLRVRHGHLPSLCLHKGTSLGLVGIDRSLFPTNIYISGCAEITAPTTVLTCVGVMLPSPWSQTESLVLGILWVYVGLWASVSKGLGSDTHVDFISHRLSRILLFLDVLKIPS